MAFNPAFTLLGAVIVLIGFQTLRKTRSGQLSVLGLILLIIGIYIAAIGLGLASMPPYLSGNSTSTTSG